MAAGGTGGDIAAVEDIQVETQVGQVEVHWQPQSIIQPLDKQEAPSVYGRFSTVQSGLTMAP
ncbi:hypothetical protein D3C76_1475020 [compost metagenome]